VSPGHTSDTGDVFARIAAAARVNRPEQLITPQPPARSETVLEAERHDPTAAFATPAKMHTDAELREALEAERQRITPFLRQLGPPLPATRQVVPLRRFAHRMCEPDDLRDVQRLWRGEGEWQIIDVPHYWGPTGRATAWYRTTFTLEAEQVRPDRRVWIRFRGVDYSAAVSLNGYPLGEHEGFFAPFEFDASDVANAGENVLLIRVDNDFKHNGQVSGDKIYAATGLGWDDPQDGWHHCPAGMGICQPVEVQIRAVNHIDDNALFVRPLIHDDRAEAWVEIYRADPGNAAARLHVQVYPRNFEADAQGGIKTVGGASAFL